MVDAYKRTLDSVVLWGPTKFAPIFEYVCDMAEKENVHQANQKYFICLIITDGQIMDLEETID